MDNAIELTQAQALKLMAAGHALRMPSGAYGVTHQQAREIIMGLVGSCPEGAPAGPLMNDCLVWLGLARKR